MYVIYLHVQLYDLTLELMCIMPGRDSPLPVRSLRAKLCIYILVPIRYDIDSAISFGITSEICSLDFPLIFEMVITLS